MNPELVEGLFIRDDDEGLFSRDIDGQLVRLDSPVAADYEKTVTLQIDGQSVTVPLAEPLKDAQGNIVQDVNGRTTPRYTTIYDAAVKLYVKEPGDEAKIPIPTLCHLEHMRPVAICRLCVVQIYGTKRGKRAAERKLLPACQHQVKDGMEVFTMNAQGADGERVRQTVKVLTEMLAVDHLKPAEPPTLEKEFAPFNELAKMCNRCDAKPERLKLDVLSAPPPPTPPSVGRRGPDASSPVFMVDHSACILCERCIRACDDVQKNFVIGRTGKGATAGISFDLNDPMGGSSCVQCGECMVSCPTSAIMFKSSVSIKTDAKSQPVSPAELLSDRTFSGISPKFLLWQQGLVVSKKLKKNDVLCRKGDAGNTAFVIKSGVLGISLSGKETLPKEHWEELERKRRLEPKHLEQTQQLEERHLAEKQQLETETLQLEPSQQLEKQQLQFKLHKLETADLLKKQAAELKSTGLVREKGDIIGEMACMTGTPRAAGVIAMDQGVVWEVRRNVLDRFMRLPSLKDKLEKAYRERVLSLVLRESELFQNLDAESFKKVVEYVGPKISFVRVRPKQTLFEQDDPAEALYFVRLGHVRVGVLKYGAEAKVLSRGPGAIIGEIGLLGLSRKDINRGVDEIDDALKRALECAGDNLSDAVPAGGRTATCSALGYLELARLSREDFLGMVKNFPVVRRRLVEVSLSRLAGERTGEGLQTDYVNQGLYEGRSILVLDLDRCTRCDQCTRGCVEEHGRHSHGVPIPRLLRDGERFANFVVATSCRSCLDPHCMVGCPVDSIHRGKHLQIVIEDHCIGCGLCASNCPYGSIFMEPNRRKLVESHDQGRAGGIMVGQLKAAACDLCDSHGDDSSPDPQCVASCPHDAAFRVTGPELLQRVLGRR